MLNKYIAIDGERIPNPTDYSEEFGKISNTFQSEAGDDLVIDIRAGKHSASMTFQVSSHWRDKLKAYAEKPSISLQVDADTYESRIESISCSLEKNSERAAGTQGYWTVSFTTAQL